MWKLIPSPPRSRLESSIAPCPFDLPGLAISGSKDIQRHHGAELNCFTQHLVHGEVRKVTLWLCQNSYRKSPCSMGKSTISMAIFHSYVAVYQRVKEHATKNTGKVPSPPSIQSLCHKEATPRRSADWTQLGPRKLNIEKFNKLNQ